MTERPRLAVIVNYYYPYVSGLTEAARFVAAGMVERGWDVTVVCGRHDTGLPHREVIDGVGVVRAPVVAKLSKGLVSPAFPVLAARALRHADVGNLHMPMLEAGLISRLAGSTPLGQVYQCDVNLPATAANRFIVSALDWSSTSALRRAERRVVSSFDYARSSRLAALFVDRTEEIAPPTVDRSGGSPAFREGSGAHIGFLGRIVEEKGIEYLVDAFRMLDLPGSRLLIGGSYDGVAGGSVIDRLRSRVGDDRRVAFLGFLPDDQLADFYASLDVFALPAVNSLEAFGIVQVEAMLAGVPSVASNLPGVRAPVQNTGMGRIVEPGDAVDLARGLREALDQPKVAWVENRARVAASYSETRTLDRFESVFVSLLESRRH